MAGYNRTRYVEELLEKTETLPPSFTVHLHVEYWTLNQGSKFLYNNQIASLLDDIRAQRIPVDFLDLFEAAKVPFYDGCMIVELLDYRPQGNKEPTLEKPERTRAVLHPNAETLWADICSLNQKHGGKWTDRDSLDIEARILLAISPPLCLDPDPHLTRIANHVLRVSTPTVPVSLKRKAAALEPEEDETDKARRTKIMQFMNPQPSRHSPSYRILDAIHKSRQGAVGKPPTPLPTNQYISQASPTKPSTPAQNFAQPQTLPEADDKKDVKAKKADVPQTHTAGTFTRSTGGQTPVPPSTTHQFINQLPPNNPSPAPISRSPMQPQVFPNLQAATDSAKRTPTPAQRQPYSQSPRPPPSQPPTISHQQSHPQSSAGQAPNSTFQGTIPHPQFLNAPPSNIRNVGSKPNTVQQIAPQPPGIPNFAQPIYPHQSLYLQQQQQQQQQRINAAQKTGRSTPQAQAGQHAPSPARSSPMVTSKPLAARSPMPPNAQPPLQKHPPQHPHTVFTPYNPAALRPMVHGNPSPHPQAMPAHTASSSGSGMQPAAASPLPQATSEGQTQMMYPQMYGYNMNYAQMQAAGQRMGYWQLGMGVGRGVPGLVNGQPMPGMTAAPPQMPVGGKPGPTSIPGR